jgi:hypothetical protein
MMNKTTCLVLLLLAGRVHAAAKNLVELLKGAHSEVAVSSQVNNPKHLPEHLVDGKLDTAWNSRTGDLEGAWISFRVPRSARVRQIKLTVGFTHVEGKDDWFTMNPRVTKVAVAHDGQHVADFTLDPQKRELQELAVDGDGGEWTIEVTGVLPGSKPNWREICVSELEVWGTIPDDERTAPGPPHVSVGQLPPADCSSGEPISGSFVSKKREALVLRSCVVEKFHNGPPDSGRDGQSLRGDLVVTSPSGDVVVEGVERWGEGYEAGHDEKLLGPIPLGDGRDAVALIAEDSGMGQRYATLRVLSLEGGAAHELWKTNGMAIEADVHDGALVVTLTPDGDPMAPPQAKRFQVRGVKGKLSVKAETASP